MIRKLIARTRVYSRAPTVYEKWIDVWAGLLGGAHQLHQAIEQGLDPQPGERLLDLCCGTGRYTIPLCRASQEASLMGVDAAPRMLDFFSRQEGARGVALAAADARALPFSPGAFHKILICGALHEMPAADRARVLAEAGRVLRPGGQLMIIEPTYPEDSLAGRAAFAILFHPLNPERHTLREMLRADLGREVEAAGLRLISRSTSNRGFMQHLHCQKEEPPSLP